MQPGNFGGMGMQPGNFGGMGMQQQQQQQQRRPQPPVEYGAIPINTTCTVKNILSNDSLNGERCVVTGFDSKSKRATVEIENTTMALKQSNLLQNVEATIFQTSRNELNGQRIVIIDEIENDEDEFRYLVYSRQAKKTMSLKTENVKFLDRSCLRVEGLKGNPENNGLYGKVEGFEEGRYLVRVSKAKILKIKMINVRV